MKILDVKEVIETMSPDDANILLAQGWQLLAIHPSRYPRHAAVYILGAQTHTEGFTNAPALPAS